ncbi:hypothetical protein [Pedobacter sandarakinus]|uniref:hypothetical protein n=1 Tax=Pedobacter sandarakinus TaxID=353156 RepID=UPI00224558C0|nr:hypothetical protein [Pedobacter sandarakinus]MCX2576094.1 hypothetical protein [Pedobacter sandarakinus]
MKREKINFILYPKNVLYLFIGLLTIASVFYACKKTIKESSLLEEKFTLRSEAKIKDLNKIIESSSLKKYLTTTIGLDLGTATLKKLNETDTLEIISIFYKNSTEKALFIMHFKKSNSYLPMGLEHQRDLVSQSDKIILSDYLGTIINIEEYKEKKFIGFVNNIKINEINSGFSGSREKWMLVDPSGNGSESCYHCINRVYQDTKTKCEADFVCDIGCSFNLACKALFLASATAVCTSGGSMPRPCGIFQD